MKDDGHYKLHLVARGCQQKKDLDHKDIYSSVIQSNTLRMLLAIAASENLKILTFDIKSAFPYGNLQEEIYMRLSENFNVSGRVCKQEKHSAILDRLLNSDLSTSQVSYE